jgi:RNA polymerase sigma-70 factor, ECF subfamily
MVSTANPERAAIEQQHREQLWSAVQDLPLPDRQVVVLHLERLSAAEIEAITGLTAGAIATRLTRILLVLVRAAWGS